MNNFNLRNRLRLHGLWRRFSKYPKNRCCVKSFTGGVSPEVTIANYQPVSGIEGTDAADTCCSGWFSELSAANGYMFDSD
mmetsp:Transcript_115037/g.357346  ORF Transcript_115037/g.357346 Transcript_115037/m.357346 type:complete len:80 (-) Transcript_115037:119-358(-)